MRKALIIAGERSGCGKTLVSLGIMAALKKRGLAVQPFKTGPDFIDPGHHERVTGRPSHNLDAWMTGPDSVSRIFSRYARDCDAAVIEGAMGLFDGASGTSDEGSTAQVAKLIGAPVVLVLDARSLARSAAALVQGYLGFDPDLNTAGLIFNRTGSDSHAEIIREAVSGLPAAPRFIGFLPRDTSLAMPSRHLGLVTDQDQGLTPRAIDKLGAWAEQNLDLQGLLDELPGIELAPVSETPAKPASCGLAVARDAAFCFCYRENLRLLEELGAKLLFFSPLTDQGLPEGADALYLPGGYPELHAEALSGNANMLAEIRAFASAGKAVYAECGGFMYLMRELTDSSGRLWPMAGVFEMSARLGERFKALGYREIQTKAAGPFGPAGTILRGHEFHYSAPEGPDPGARAVFDVSDRKGRTCQAEGFLKDNTLGSYIHLHLASNPEAAGNFVKWCGGRRR